MKLRSTTLAGRRINGLLVRACIASLVVFVAWSASPCRASDEWPQFRGPDGQGHAAAADPPLTWSDKPPKEQANVAWKTPIPGLGWSSPVISGDRIWLTTALDDGRSLKALCIDRLGGLIVGEYEVFRREEAASIHTKNSHASPTPVLERGRVYVHFGTYGTACLDESGNQLWTNTELVYEHGHGPAGSPVLYQDLLILSCDGTDIKFVVALNKNTGEVRWRRERDGRMAYSTPLVIRVGEEDLVVSPGGDQVVAYQPLTGEEKWRLRYDGYSVVPRPVFAHGLVFVSSGYNDPILYAIKADGAGDVTNSHLAWTLVRGAPHNPSGVVVGANLYLVSDNGIATCVDAQSGKVHWTQRLGGNYSASPLAVGDRVYFQDEDGKTTVVRAGIKFERLAVNEVAGRTLASMAAVDDSLYLRTDSHVYRLSSQE